MKFIKLSIIALFCFSVIACSEEEKQGGELFGQQAALYKIDSGDRKPADFSERTSISVATDDIGVEKEQQFLVTLAKENTRDITVYMDVNQKEVEKYNRVYKTSYLSLPEKNLKITPKLNIKSGNVTSEVGKVKVRISSDLKENTPYMFAISMSSVNGDDVQINKISNTLFYTLEIVKGQINRTVKITRNEYFELEGAKYIGNTFTLEGLIFIEKLRGDGDMGEAGISTFMGVERETLLRFGDSGVDPDQLQANTQKVDFKFKTKKWYHIALVVEGGKSIVYINGKKVAEFAKGGSLVGTDPFYIGRSYSDQRGIEARFSELRIWKVARSGQQIKEGIYEVDKNSADLYAYWKMNEVVNNKIMDASENGINLILKGQAGKTGTQKIEIFEEQDPVKID